MSSPDFKQTRSTPRLQTSTTPSLGSMKQCSQEWTYLVPPTSNGTNCSSCCLIYPENFIGSINTYLLHQHRQSVFDRRVMAEWLNVGHNSWQRNVFEILRPAFEIGRRHVSYIQNNIYTAPTLESLILAYFFQEHQNGQCELMMIEQALAVAQAEGTNTVRLPSGHIEIPSGHLGIDGSSIMIDGNQVNITVEQVALPGKDVFLFN